MATRFTSLLAASGLIATLGGVSTSAHAHHAFAAEFDANKPIELRGTITRLQWTNPHSWIYVAVTDEDGVITSWAVEFGAPYSLLQKGLRRTDFEIGTEVIINGFLAKSGEPVLNASNVTLPDGRDFLTGAEDSPGAGN